MTLRGKDSKCTNVITIVTRSDRYISNQWDSGHSGTHCSKDTKEAKDTKGIGH